jgi:hypothetical protein
MQTLMIRSPHLLIIIFSRQTRSRVGIDPDLCQSKLPAHAMVPYSFIKFFVLLRVVSMASPVEQAPPIATTTKMPTYEYYGFVMYLVSFVALGKIPPL